MKKIEDLTPLFHQISQIGQKEYDAWSQDDTGYDEEVGFGGICHLIADQIVYYLNSTGFESVSHSLDSEVHVLVIVKLQDGVYALDIPYNYYEAGAGYVWKKKPNIIFDKTFVTLNKISGKIEDFEQYLN